MVQHKVILYDENGFELEKTMESIHVTHVTRWKHTFGGYIVYSFNSHLDNGMVCYGLIPLPSFC